MSSLLPGNTGATPGEFAPAADAVRAFLRTELDLEVAVVPDASGGPAVTLCGADEASAAHGMPVVGLLADLLGSLLQQEHELVVARRDVAAAMHDASTDPLTGVSNRRHWEAALAMEAERFRRYANAYAVVVVDLDGLKDINERLGHVAGDELIALAGTMLRACVRPSDTVARLGGDEFGILAIECNSEGASALTTRLSEAFAAAGVPVSLGAAVARPGRDGDATWSSATAAMFASKATLGSLADALEGLRSTL